MRQYFSANITKYYAELVAKYIFITRNFSKPLLADCDFNT